MSDSLSPGDNMLKGIDPEQLMVIAPEHIPLLLAIQYPGIVDRAAELLERAREIMAQHENGAIPIADDDENGMIADLMKQLRDFAGDNGEADVVRKRVKAQPYEAVKRIDGWFGQLTDPIIEVMGQGRSATVGTMQYATTQYLQAKARREQAERDEIARRAREHADQLLLEAQRNASDDVMDAAIQAEEMAAVTAVDAAAPVKELVRSRTAIGTTSTLTSSWDFEVRDIKALCAAVVDGVVPTTFVTTNDQAIRLAIRAKKGPVRECPGLEIKQIFSSARR